MNQLIRMVRLLGDDEGSIAHREALVIIFRAVGGGAFGAFAGKAVAHWAVICYNKYADGRKGRDPLPHNKSAPL